MDRKHDKTIKSWLAGVALATLPGIVFAFPIADYFPLTTGASWTYTGNYSTSVTGGTTNINGIATKELLGNDGNSEYFTNDNSGIRLHRIELDPEDLGLPASATVRVTFDPPIKFANADANIGDLIERSGTGQMFIKAGSDEITLPADYSSSSNLQKIESVTVPFGTFDAVKIILTFTLSAEIDGDTLEESATSTLWLSRGLGIIKDSELGFGTLELVSTNQTPYEEGPGPAVGVVPVFSTILLSD